MSYMAEYTCCSSIAFERPMMKMQIHIHLHLHVRRPLQHGLLTEPHSPHYFPHSPICRPCAPQGTSVPGGGRFPSARRVPPGSCVLSCQRPPRHAPVATHAPPAPPAQAHVHLVPTALRQLPCAHCVLHSARTRPRLATPRPRAVHVRWDVTADCTGRLPVPAQAGRRGWMGVVWRA